MPVGFMPGIDKHDGLTNVSLCHGNCGMIFYDVDEAMVGRTHSSMQRSVFDQLPVHYSCVDTTGISRSSAG